MRTAHLKAVLAGIGLAAGGLTGCTDWLRVTNPGAIENPALEDSAYIGLMVNGVIGDFQPAFAWTALFSGAFTDELRNHHGFFENGEIDRRAVGELNGTYIAAVYAGLHRARFLGDSAAGRIKILRGAAATTDLRLARVLAYAGYSWLLLGEQLCETPINRSAPVPSDELLATAIQRFDEAIAVAATAKAADTTVAGKAGADSITNFARIGAARAALNLNDGPRAMPYATAVTPAYASEASRGFEFRASYRDGATSAERRRYGNPFWEFQNNERWFSVSGTPYDSTPPTSVKDPRVPQELRSTADGSTRLVPNSPHAFSTYTASLTGGRFQATSTITVASALEARYILAEVGGLTAAEVRAFIDQRRAVGGQAAFPGTDAELPAELRQQRRRDFFLDGHRLGDLRRYKRYLSIDEFPSGPYFGSATVSYGTQECWPIPATER